jgi:diacylglycerol kinase (ATP)
VAAGTLVADSERTLDSQAMERLAAVERMSRGHGPVTRVLIVSRGAKQVTAAVQRKLDSGFPGYEQMEFDPRSDVWRRLRSRATVVVAGGDGTVGFVARALAGSRRRLGILPLGTFNNFAHGLRIPANLDRAIAVVRKGATRPVTLGQINGRYFLEAAAIGVFGEAIVLGEKAKDRAFGELAHELGAVVRAEPFAFATSGAFVARGHSRSLVFTNSPTTGSRLPIGGTTPTDPFLELSIEVGASRTDIVSRVVASAVGEHSNDEGIRFQFHSLTISTKPPITVVADNEHIGRTPVTVEAIPNALRVIVPA